MTDEQKHTDSAPARASQPSWRLSLGSAVGAMAGVMALVATVTWVSRDVVPPDAPLGVRFAWVFGAANVGLSVLLLVRLWCPPWRSTSPPRSQQLLRAAASAVACAALLVVIGLWIAPLQPMLALANALLLVVLSAEATLTLRRGLTRPIPSRIARIGVSILVLAVGAWLWAILGFFLSHAQLSVLPTRAINQSPPIDPAIGERAIEIQTEDGLTLRGTYTPGHPGAPGVVLCHGVSNGQKQMADLAADLATLGYHAVRCDFRAHGLSDGTVCTFTGRETLDVRAAFHWLGDQPGVDGTRIVLIGNSMGGGAVLRATGELPRDRLRAVVGFAPASDLELMADYRLQAVGPLAEPTKAIIADLGRALGDGPFTEMSGSDALDEVADLPVLVFHGTIDVTIPPSLSESLQARHPGHVDVVWVNGAGHEEVLPDVLSTPDHHDRLITFLRGHTGHRAVLSPDRE